MAEPKKISVAEQIDRFMQRSALGVFLVAIAYAITAVEFFVTEEIADTLNIVSTGLGIFIIILILPAFLKFVNLKRKNREACRDPEGFVVEMFNKATGRTFQFTFIFLIFLDLVTGIYQTHLPAEFFIKLIVAATLGFFSLMFFFLNRSGDFGEDA